jgi:uncharacterized protein (DUF58 family)
MPGTWATITPRSTGLIGGGLVSLLVAMFTLHLLLFTLGIITIAFVAAEYLSFSWTTRGFSPTWFQAERLEAPEHVKRKALGTIALRLTHGGRSAFYAEIWDSYPQTFRMVEGSPHLVTWWAPGEQVTLVYAFRPYRRGKYAVGPTAVLAHDAFGFAFRLTYVATAYDMTVVPAVPSVAMGNFALRLRTKFLGTTALRKRGYGTEFRSLRDYSPSDDFRTIAWKRSTRGRIYVKEFEQEMRQDFLVLLNVSTNMGMGRLGEDALDLAVDAATVMANYVMRKEDRIGLLAYGRREVSYVPPERGMQSVSMLVNEMAILNPVDSSFDLVGALRSATKHLTDRTHVFAFTVVAPPTREFLDAYTKFTAHGHKLYIFTPDCYTMYPAYPDDDARKILGLAQGVTSRFQSESVRAMRNLGIPVIQYDRQGAIGKVISLYSTLRAWGWAR